MITKSRSQDDRDAVKLRLLLVDDNPDDRALVMRELSKESPALEITEVLDQAGLNHAIEARKFDLVITDFHLRWSTGLEVLKLAKARHPHVPVIMFTGTGSEEAATEAMRSGLSDYVIKNPRHMERLRHAVRAALHRAAEVRARQRAEDLLSDALQHMEDGFMLFDAEDKLVICNEKLHNFYPGLREVLVPGADFESLARACLQADKYTLTPAQRPSFLAERLRAHRQGSENIEQQLADGRWVLIKERRSHDGGCINIYTDITTLKQRELELKALVSEHMMLSAATQQSVTGVLVMDVHSEKDRYPVVYVNPAFERITGFPYAEICGHDWREFAEKAETLPQVRKRIRSAFKQHEAISLETVTRHKDGKQYWNSLSISPVFDAHGELRFYMGIITDISERVRTSEILQEHVQMLGEAEHLAKLGHFRWDIQADRTWRSQENYEIRGLTADNAPQDFRGTLQTFVPEDREVVSSIISGVAENHTPAEVEARITRPDGETRHVHIIAKYRPATAETGEAVFGTLQDVTNQKQQEIALRRSERRYRRLMESIPHGVAELSTDGVIRYANQAIHIMLGYTRGDLMGKTLFEHIVDPVRRAECVQRMQMMTKGEVLTQTYTTQCQAVGGQAMDVQVAAVVSRNDTGKINGTTIVTTDITEQLQSEQRLRYLAYYDSLTGLGNRALLNVHLRDQLAQRHDAIRVAVVLFNIDSFKMINDVLGHGVGDSVLREFGARLAATCSYQEDVARLSADEFSLVLTGEFQREALQAQIREIKQSLEAPLQVSGNRLDIRLSAGVAVAPEDGMEAEELLRNADNALLDVKREAPGELRFYDAKMKSQVEELLMLRGHLRSASIEREFFLEYQPQVELESGRITGVEALLRWRMEDGSMIPPVKFIPVAEQSGDIIPLGRWVLETACRQGMAWRTHGLAPLPISVNISARQFLRGDLLETVNGILKHTGFDPHYLYLELTETALMTDSTTVLQQMHRLTDLGINFSLDDFGTGYSSLSYLGRFPIATLKIDRSFVSGMSMDSKHMAIVGALVAMSRTLGLTVVAEGVEEPGQVENLRAIGCNLAQGYFYSRPVPADKCEALLRSGVLRPGTRH